MDSLSPLPLLNNMEPNRGPMTKQAALKELEEFRSRIDAVDRSILLLLNERTKVVEEIGRVKQKAQLPIYEPRREDQVFDNVIRHNTGPSDGAGRAPHLRTHHRRDARRAAGADGKDRGGRFQMLVVMQEGATEQQIQAVIDRLVELGFNVHRSTGVVHTVLGGVGGKGELDLAIFDVMDGVKEAVRIASPYKLASRNFRPQGTVVKVGDIEVGGERVVVMAGPCSVESQEQIAEIAGIVAGAGATVIRGGAFKPRSSPYSFQGLGEEGLRYLRDAADRHGLKVVSEVMDHTQIPLLREYSDILQVGARNMQNFNLLRELGKERKPVLLEARHRGHHRRAAAFRRIHHGGRELRRHPVRARHPHIRNLYAQHHGYFGDSGGAQAVAPAHRGRSFARHGTARQGAADGAARRWRRGRTG